MVEKIIINPEAIRGLGNILDPKTSDDFESYLSIVETDTEVINGQSMIVYNADYSNDTITLTASSSSITYGQSVTFTATVVHNDTTPITGASVVFKNVNGYTMGTSTTNNNGVATFTYTPGPSELVSVTATYKTKASNIVNVTVNQLTPTITFSTSSNSIFEGQSLTLTATTTYNGNPIENALIQFKEGTTTLGSAWTNSDGVATFILDNLSVGYHSLTAYKVSDTVYAPVTSTSKTVQIKADNELKMTHFQFKRTDQSYVEKGYYPYVCYPQNDSSRYTSRVTVTTMNGTKVEGVSVRWYLNDTLETVTYTNVNGIATGPTFPLGTAGEYKLEAVVLDQGGYTGCDSTFDNIVITDSTIEACSSNVADYLVYDDCLSDNTTDYGSSIAFSGNSSNTLTFNNIYYVLSGSGGYFSGRKITALDGVDDATVRIRFSLNTTTNAAFNQLFLCCTDQTPSSTEQAYPYCVRVRNDKKFQYFTFTSEETLYTHSTNFSNQVFCLEAIKDGTKWTMKLYDDDSNLLASESRVLSSMSNPNWYFGLQTEKGTVYSVRIFEIVAYK